MSRQLRITVGFDLVCPWCLIGLRNLQRALVLLQASAPDVTAQLCWEGVQLLPTIPQPGLPFLEFYRHRLGGEAAMQQRQAQVVRAAEAAGARIDYARISVMPNTADAHRLLQYVAHSGGAARHEALLDRLFTAYFERGEDLADPAVLLAHGAACGLARDELAPLIQGAGAVFAGTRNRHGGVPYFTFNGALPLTGAQPVEVLLGTMRAALIAGQAHQA